MRRLGNREELTGSVEIEHTGDVSFRVRGRKPRELFENAARAMFRLQSCTPGAANIVRRVCAKGCDRETLLVNWLNELLYLQEICEEVYHDCKIGEISETSLLAEVIGGPRWTPYKLIKAATFHNLKIEAARGGLAVTIVFDV